MSGPESTANNSAHPYENLTPDCILDALEDVGFEPTGSLLALNSYENRVYQVSLEDGRFVIAKFYRPDRWPDAAILEEHAFSQELVEQEIQPRIQVGEIVLCDRYADSTIAYQGYGHRVNLTQLRSIVDFATGGLKPDLTLLLDLDVSVPCRAGSCGVGDAFGGR